MILILLLLLIGAVVLCTQLLIRRFGYSELTYSLAFSVPEATEGDTVTLTETICSRKPIPLPWVKAELTTHASLLIASEQSAVSEDTRFISSFFCLFPYRKIERRWKVTCTKRGIFSVSHAVILISDLFGTMELSKPYPEAEAFLTVLPAVREIGLPPILPQQLTGDMLRNRNLIPDRFAICGIRQYTDGDPVRDICQTASARSENLMVWQYQETAVPGMTILLNLETRETDRDRVSDRAVYENAVRLCAAYLGKAAAMRIPVRFAANTLLNGQPAETRFGNDADALTGHLRLLAALTDEIACKFEHLLLQCVNRDPTAAILVITAQPTAAILRCAEADARITVLSLRPLPNDLTQRNVYHIAISA
ncbi:MAG TPA: hypothetical protein DCG49_09965 [Ruminococcus sp.]|nr:hypothetical protein [Ruminococcus sp.]